MLNQKNKINKLLQLSAICLAINFVCASQAFAADKKAKMYGDWKIVCETAKKTNKKTCFAEQTVTSKKDEKDVPVATYQFSYGEKKQLKLFQILPQGLYLQPGTALVVDKELLAPGKFTLCQNNVCLALSDVSSGDISNIYKSENISLAIVSGEGKQISLPFSKKGLKEALSQLK